MAGSSGSVRISAAAAREIEEIGTRGFRRQVVAKLLELGENPLPSGRRRLAASGKYRLRIGRHRLLYLVTDGGTGVVIVAILEEARGGG